MHAMAQNHVCDIVFELQSTNIWFHHCMISSELLAAIHKKKHVQLGIHVMLEHGTEIYLYKAKIKTLHCFRVLTSYLCNHYKVTIIT